MSVVDPALSKESEEGVEASTSGMMETTMMEGEEYYNPDETGTWTQKATTDQLCRICAKPNQYLIPIFEGEGIEHQLEPKIQKHLPIEVSETDDLPLQVCYQCASTLIAWNDLVIACVEADKKLRQMHEQEEEDEDDKGAEFFDEPTMDSDEGEEPVQPSTSTATVTSEVQGDTPSPPKKAAGKAKKPKLKMTLVKSPTAGPSSQKSPPKKTLAKSKEAASQDATERLSRAPMKTSLIFFLRRINEVEPSLAMYPQLKITDVRTVSVKESPSGASCKDLVMSVGNQECPNEQSKINENKVKEESMVKEEKGSKVKEESKVKEKKLSRSRKSKPLTDEDSVTDSLTTNPSQHTLNTKCKRIKKMKVIADVNFTSNPSDGGIDLKLNEGEKKLHRTFECEQCSKVLTSRSKLDAHVRIHTGERPFVCHICGKSFRVKCGIQRHIREFHERVRNYPCQICGKSFMTKRTLVDHTTIHTGIREFTCHICGKSFKTRNVVMRHRIYHTDEFPFQCPFCDLKYRTRAALSLHIPRRHTKEKSHVCDVCGKGFSLKSSLTQHRLVHTSIESVFACTSCEQTFKQKRYLQIHVRKYHKKTPEAPQ